MKVLKNAIDDILSKEQIGRCDFHTHSFFSDGVLLPMEQLRRAHVVGHEVYAITDHVSASNLDIIPKIARDCELAIKHWGIVAISGVEITHVPANAIPDIAKQAKEIGAQIVVVHGETISEPVEEGTNLIAAKCKDVDILAHPGMITNEEAKYCKRNNIFVEITSNPSHSVANGHVKKIGLQEDVQFIQNTDTHRPQNMMKYSEVEKFLFGNGFTKTECEIILQDNVKALLSKIFERI